MRVTPGEVLVFILVVLGVLLIGSLFLMFFWGMGSMGWGMMGPGMMGPGFGGMGTWWWLMGCLIPLGLVLLIVLGVAGLLGVTQRTPAASPTLQQTCPSCGQNVQDDWQVCPYCGTSLEEQGV